MVSGAEILVRALEQNAVSHVFVLPGEETIALLDAFRKSKIEVVTARHEQEAGFMAATVGRLTGRPGVCITTLGPGATNLTTPVAHAQLGGFPLVVITAQKGYHDSEKFFQKIPLVELFSPITKASKTLLIPSEIPFEIKNAFQVALEKRCGVVHLELPEDVSEMGLVASRLPQIDGASTSLLRADSVALKETAQLFAKSTKPLLVVGAGAANPTTAQALRKFVETTHCPTCATQMGSGVIAADNPYFLGVVASRSDPSFHQIWAQADLICCVGYDVVESPPFLMDAVKAPIIHISDFSTPHSAAYTPEKQTIGSIAYTVDWLTNRVGSKRWHPAVHLSVAASDQADKRERLSIYQVIDSLEKCLPQRATVALDNGFYKLFFARFFKAYQPNQLLLDNMLATMGAGLCMAIAAKMIAPEKPVVAVCGDGGFMMNSQALETACRYGLDLTVLVLVDDAYGMIAWKQAKKGVPISFVRLGNPNFVTYAAAYGATGYKVTTPDQLKERLKKTLASKGVHLIEVPIHYPAHTCFD